MSHNDSHDHGHGYSHDNHDHDHDHGDETEPALQTLIWKQIDFDKVRTLNESESNAGAKVIKKTWQQALNPIPELVSDSDEQLLLFIPYALYCIYAILKRSLTCSQLYWRLEIALYPSACLHIVRLSPDSQNISQ